MLARVLGKTEKSLSCPKKSLGLPLKYWLLLRKVRERQLLYLGCGKLEGAEVDDPVGSKTSTWKELFSESYLLQKIHMTTYLERMELILG